VTDLEYLITFAVMLVVALVISTLAVRLRQQAEAARQRERRTAALYAMSRELSSTRGTDDLLQAAARHIHEVFESQVSLVLPDATGRLRPWDDSTDGQRHGPGGPMLFALDTKEQIVAQGGDEHRQMAGRGTATLRSGAALYLPLLVSRGAVGVLGVRPTQPRRLTAPEQVHLLETFASQIALVLERAILAEEAQHAQVQIETE